MKTSILLLALGMFVTLTACAADMSEREVRPKKGVESEVVKLQVAGNPKRLQIVSGPNNRCMKKDKVGCVYVGKNMLGIITFRLLQSQQWALTEMYICNGDRKPTDCKLSDIGIGEFTATHDGLKASPSSAGLVNLTGLGEELSGFQLVNQNNVKADYFYWIQVCQKDDSDNCLSLDPGIENRGVGN